MFDILTAAEWDAVRNWVATVGGVAALLIAALTYRRNVRIKREEQARLVFSKVKHVENHDPGEVFDLLPREAQSGNACPDAHLVMVSENGSEEAKALAVAPLMQATVVVCNGSKELIGPVRVQMVNTGRKFTWDGFSISVMAIAPESEHVVDFKWRNTDHPGVPGVGSTVIFRDSSGQWWRRHLAEPIERVHNEPFSSCGDLVVL